MTTNDSSDEQLSFKAAFDADPDLVQYKQNALSIFALTLYLRIEDVQSFAAESITEGPNDKKIDICYLDPNEKLLVIAQSYLSPNWGKAAAPSNKASDLNTAMAWLLSVGEDRVPPHLKNKATDLRRALVSGDVRRIEICLIHNCHESQNVEDELKAVAEATRDMTRALVQDGEAPVVVYKEFGLESIEELYRSRDSEILIDQIIDVPSPRYILEKGNGWKSLLTTISGKWIQDLHKTHGDRLFSANYRDYLGSTKQRGNINNEIRQTAESEPANFWVYNNGITALTYEIRRRGKKVKIRGISIINGAQTSGALSETAEAATSDTRVLIRFVECSSRDLIDKIIRYNNTQNEIKPADKRSNDPVQKRLRDEFSRFGITYIHRRSSARTPRNAITAAAIAPALCAFHGQPQIAYRNSKEIFGNDDTYERVFPRNITVEHVFLIRSLSVAIDRVKTDLNAKTSDNNATELEGRQYEVLKYSASKHFVFYVIGQLTEEIMGRRMSDRFEWKCKPALITPENVSLQNSWGDALRALLPHVATIVEQQGKDAFYEVPRSLDQSKQVARQLKALIASLESVLGSQFNEIRTRTSI